jgi:rubredoxin-NAD+ reductase
VKKWLCVICGLIYDEALGWPQDGIAAGTRWEDVPADWVCPDCKVGKSDFDMLEIGSPVVAAASPLALPPAATVARQAPAPASVPRGPIVIVGSGHAGYGLAAALRKADPGVEIRVLTQDDGYLYSKPALSIGLAQGKTAAALAAESPLAVEQRLNLRVYSHCRVEHIDSAARHLHTSLGEMAYGQLVLACGARPISAAISGDQTGVVSVNNLDDYRAFRARLDGARRVAILGDGLIGCEFANDLAANGYEVSVIGLGRWPMARLLPEAAGQHLRAALAACGVRWHLQNTVHRIDAVDAAWRLTLADGGQLDADLVLSAIGLRPDLALAARAGLDVGSGVRVDPYLQTSQPGIYALGDCLEIGGQLLPYLAPIGYGIAALSQTLLGKPTAVRYPLMPVTVKTPVMPVCLLAPDSAAGEWRCTTTADGVHATFHDAGGAMRGFALIGHEAQRQRHASLQMCQPEPATA